MQTITEHAFFLLTQDSHCNNVFLQTAQITKLKASHEMLNLTLLSQGDSLSSNLLCVLKIELVF